MSPRRPPAFSCERSRVSAAAILAGTLLSLVAAASCALTTAGGAKNSGAAANSVFVSDKGKLRVLLDRQQVASEEFELSPSGSDWIAHGVVEIKIPSTPVTHVSATMRLGADGVPQSYDWSSQTEKKNGAHIVFENGVAKITLQMQGASPFQQDITFATAKVVILDNNVYHHYALLARVYDWSKGGAQTFPVFIPQDLTPGSITVDSKPAQTVEGKSFEMLQVSTSDLEVLLFLDSTHRTDDRDGCDGLSFLIEEGSCDTSTAHLGFLIVDRISESPHFSNLFDQLSAMCNRLFGLFF